MERTDRDLLAAYVRDKGEDAFAEIVRQHLNLVYGAALRQVRSAQLAEEVAQCVFLELARQANVLSPDTILAAWLYKVTQRISLNFARSEVRRRTREQTVSEMNAIDASSNEWQEIEPLLDEGMHSLDENDRAAVLLRFFENKSLREVGQYFGASEDAAQKRISRALERLRQFFLRRGIPIATGSLAMAIAANAVHAAPAGLNAAITSAVILGKPITATVITTKAIAMTALQKSIVAAAIILVCGTATVWVSSKTKSENPKAGENVVLNLDKYLGTFEMTGHKIELKKQANGLAVDIDGNPAFVAYAKASDKFVSHDHNSLTELTFALDNSGRATQFTLVRDGQKLGELQRTSR